jgi:hypothetical protein
MSASARAAAPNSELPAWPRLQPPLLLSLATGMLVGDPALPALADVVPELAVLPLLDVLPE